MHRRFPSIEIHDHAYEVLGASCFRLYVFLLQMQGDESCLRISKADLAEKLRVRHIPADEALLEHLVQHLEAEGVLEVKPPSGYNRTRTYAVVTARQIEARLQQYGTLTGKVQ